MMVQKGWIYCTEKFLHTLNKHLCQAMSLHITIILLTKPNILFWKSKAKKNNKAKISFSSGINSFSNSKGI